MRTASRKWLRMAVVGSRLYIACQLLNTSTFAPAPQGLIVVVDITTDQVVDMDPNRDGVQGWTLAAGNPLSLVALENQLFVSETAAFLDTEGGIEVIDVSAGTSRGLVVTEGDLGGDVGALDLISPTQGYVVVSDASFANHVVPFDLTSGAVGEPLVGHSTGFIPSIAADGNRLVVADTGTFDGSSPAGLLIYDVSTNVLIAGPISTGLPPSDIAVMRERSTATRGRRCRGLPARKIPTQCGLSESVQRRGFDRLRGHSQPADGAGGV